MTLRLYRKVMKKAVIGVVLAFYLFEQCQVKLWREGSLQYI